MNFSEGHKNWLAVGEMFPLLQKPVSAYVDEIVKDFQNDLRVDFEKNILCTNPCSNSKLNPTRGLCSSCQNWWLKKLKTAHKKGRNPSWSNNCNGEKWYEDYWEVAKFFMPSLGNNGLTVKDANSTELSALLNVIEWMKDKAFLRSTRVDLKHAQKLRSEVRNTWAHAASQELSNQQKLDYFDFAKNFLNDLKNAHPSGIAEIAQTEMELENLNTNGVSNLVRSELENLLLKSSLLQEIKGELISTRQARLANGEAINDLNDWFQEVKDSMDDCQERMKDLEQLKNDFDEHFESFEEKLTSFGCTIGKDINDMKELLQSMVHSQNNDENELQHRSCLPDQLPNFVAREEEIEDVITLFQEEDVGVVALYGGPGFGKSALAIEASHRLTNLHNTLVYFTELNTASTVNEIIRRLCRDVGVNHGEDPKSSLILWLKKINKEVVFVLDDIDNLLQPETRSEFDEFICLLRKNSNRKLKIITTSRTSYEIKSVSKFKKVEIKEMDGKSGMALLNSLCSNKNKEFLTKLGQLCGYVPLAMSIAASIVNENDNTQEILTQLEQQPMRTLNNSETNQFVSRAFNTSFGVLNQEQKDAILRLTIFQGDFNEHAAKSVLDGDNIKLTEILRELVKRSLVKKSGNRRYSIHRLIKSFLEDQTESAQKRVEANKLMVKHFLDLCAKLTTESYSCDGFLKNGKTLLQDVHNIENVLCMCSNSNNSEISEVLANSPIYQSLCRFFYHIVKNIVSETIIKKFIQACSDLAEMKEEWANRINFGLMLVEIEGRKSLVWNSEEYTQKVYETRKMFQDYKEYLENDAALEAFFYFQLGRYFLNQLRGDRKSNASNLGAEAKEYLYKSLNIRKKLPESPMAKADVILSLIQIGNFWKANSSKHYRQTNPHAEEEAEKCVSEAEKCYKEAINEAEKILGKHELTSSCHKLLGDLFFQSRKNEKALESYEFSRRMREELELNTSEAYVFLLNNIGRCLMFLDRDAAAINDLEEALSIAENLVENDEPTAAKCLLYTTLALTYNKSKKYHAKAKEMAERALEVNTKMKNKIVKRKEVKKLQKIYTSQLESDLTDLIDNRYSGMTMLVVLIVAIVVYECLVQLIYWSN